MSKADRDRADARFGKVSQPKSGQTDRDVAAKAVLDNMARLRALRLAREAAEPPRPAAAKKPRKSPKKSAEKAPALSDWLLGQQSGGRRV